MEEWKPVFGYEWLYEVSNLGRIKSLSRFRNAWTWWYIKKENIISTRLSLWYTVVDLTRNKIKKTVTIHRIIMLSFIWVDKEKNNVNHKNGIKNDNRLENLEWCTNKENSQHAWDTWLNKWNKWSRWVWKRGNDHFASKKVIQMTRNWDFIKEWWWTREIERELKIPHGNISRNCYWSIPSAWWFIWKYKN